MLQRRVFGRNNDDIHCLQGFAGLYSNAKKLQKNLRKSLRSEQINEFFSDVDVFYFTTICCCRNN